MNRTGYFILGLAALLLLAIFLLLRQNRSKFDWRETYDEAEKDPYDTYVIQQLLEDYFPDQPFTILTENIADKLLSDEPGTYVFIGEAQLMDSAAMNSLLHFVETGHTAFIASRMLPPDLQDELYYEVCEEEGWWAYYDEYWDDQMTVNLQHPQLRLSDDVTLHHVRRQDTIFYRWQYFKSSSFCEDDTAPVQLGYAQDTLVNFISVRYGEGIFLLHTMPIAFANILLLEEEVVDYAGRVFTHLPEAPIYWDRSSRVSEAVARRAYFPNETSYGRGLSDESPLQYILAQPSLAWAWYIALAMGLLYLLFRAKRQQRIIPVLESNTNTSLEFITTIGRLYFLQNNHKKLAQQKMKLFLNDIRQRHQLSTKELDAQFVDKLALRAEVPTTLVEKIVLYHKNINSSKFVSENTLLEFHQLIEEFWQTARGD